jgi:hypothetical protein
LFDLEHASKTSSYFGGNHWGGGLCSAKSRRASALIVGVLIGRELLFSEATSVFIGILLFAPGNCLERFGFDCFSILRRPAVPRNVVIVRSIRIRTNKLAGTNSIYP